MQTIEIKIPFEKRRLQAEVKHRGGIFNPKVKKWNLPDTENNRALADLVALPLAAPTVEERIHNVAQVAVDLLYAIEGQRYRLVECGNRIVIEAESISAETPTA